MVSEYLAECVGQQIDFVRPVHDYWQIGIDGGILTILVPYAVTQGSQPVSESKLIGHTVSGCDESPTKIVFHFDGDMMLTIDMRNEVCSGPEALLYWSVDGKDLVVW